MFSMNAAKVQDIIRNYKVRLFHFQGFLLICTGDYFFRSKLFLETSDRIVIVIG